MDEQYKRIKKIHTAIKNAVLLRGLAYRHAEKWVNVELGIFPAGDLNHTFSIRFDSLEDSENSDEQGIVNVVIEFVLDGKQDNYLDKIDLCVAAVRDAIDAVRESVDISGLNAHAPRFTSTYAEGMVLLTFRPIEIVYPFE